jgi:hypothetical protein
MNKPRLLTFPKKQRKDPPGTAERPALHTKKSPRRTRGNKQLKTNYLDPYSRRLIRPLPIQECIDRADLRIIILIGLHLIITIEILHIGDRIIQL